MSGVRKLKKGEILFREGDPSDAMYVIKTGRIAITKAKGASEITLAELVAGEMLGEMAFFDNKPRSAGAMAAADAEVIALPFSALHAQFKTFPEWLKAMVKTVNSHLRNANQRIKNLESATSQSAEMFDDHSITRLCAIISLIGFKAGEKAEEGLVIPSGLLRNYTIQIFQQPTHKMQKLMLTLQALGLMKIEDLGEGKQRLTILDHAKLTGFVDFYNKYLFTEDSKRITVLEKELPALRALRFYGQKQTPNDKGEVTVSLTDIQNNSMKDLNFLFQVNDADSLSEKGLTQDKQSGEGGIITMAFVLKDIEEIVPYWEIVYTLKKVPSH
ncbi:MAG: Crp/Fnr family transcriptional regulator [Bdellovibrionaceae bacterium]|nr:Crp/Fnr family transcriptional regulator [Bdellovibrionales bacterium]MCB9083664.1 Crp/Fnr family transcriptional regulator [Pseudobdellovibrionaceae bacterium]